MSKARCHKTLVIPAYYMFDNRFIPRNSITTVCFTDRFPFFLKRYEDHVIVFATN